MVGTRDGGEYFLPFVFLTTSNFVYLSTLCSIPVTKGMV